MSWEGNVGDSYVPADSEASKDLWLTCAKSLYRRGRIEKMPHVRAKNAYQRDVARKQNYLVSRTMFSIDSDRYDLIDWSK